MREQCAASGGRVPIAGLEFLRFFAALLVAFHHLAAVSWLVPTTDGGQALAGRAIYPEAYPFAWFGFVGVEIFFVISGLVIARSALNQEPWQFARNRVLRVFPGAWICASITTTAIAALHLYVPDETFRRFARSMLLMPGGPWADSVYWTLVVEMGFYFGVFYVLVLTSARYLYKFAVVIGLASSAYWLIGLEIFPNYIEAHLWGQPRPILLLLSYGIYFGLGMALFVCRNRLRLLDAAFITCMLAAACVEISLKAAAALHDFGPPAWPFTPLLAFLIACGIAVASFWIKTSEPVARASRKLGVATYPFYLLHDVVGAATVRWLVDRGSDRWSALCAALALALAASIAIATFAEPPLRSALASLFAAVEHELTSRCKRNAA